MMKIVYGFSNCTDHKYSEIMSEKHSFCLQPDQKYHGLLIRGLSENGVYIECVSGLPINRLVTKRKWIREPDEAEGKALFHYIATINIPVLRQIMIFFGTIWFCLNIKKEKDTYALCDCLNIANAYGVIIGCHLRNIPVVMIVTDIPDMMSGPGLVRSLRNWLLRGSDGFVFLTTQMDLKLNKMKKSHIVLEGHVDSKPIEVYSGRMYEEDLGKKVVIYAGGVHEIYGIKNLVEGFIIAAIPDSELWIFGDGDYKESLVGIASSNKSIKYMGVCDNQDVVLHELRATVLINPRPVTHDFTKYSFPSKNLEYMTTGTPVLTTRIPGMPKEYYQYVYLIDDASSEGIAEALKKVLMSSTEDRIKKGLAAKRFVMLNKTNVQQAEKIIKFLKREVTYER